jgi:hypothetical protein
MNKRCAMEHVARVAVALATVATGLVLSVPVLAATPPLGPATHFVITPSASGQINVTWTPGSHSVQLANVHYQVWTNLSSVRQYVTTPHLVTSANMIWVEVIEEATYQPKNAPAQLLLGRATRAIIIRGPKATVPSAKHPPTTVPRFLLVSEVVQRK